MPTRNRYPSYEYLHRVFDRDAQARARSGARLLDSDRPDWFYDIEPDRLNINDPRCCVLKQVYGSYGEALTMLGLTGEGFHHGFSGDGGQLREAWIDQAAIRLATAGPRPVRWYKRMWDTLGRVSDLAA